MAGVLRGYWERSKAPRYSLLFVLPLVVAYEMLAVGLSGEGGGLRNGADVILRGLAYSIVGAWGPVILGVTLGAVCIWLIWKDLRASGGDLRWRVILLMAIESMILAALFGIVVGTITSNLLGPFVPLSISVAQELSSAELLMLSLGAGVYEELLFRVLLVSALAFLFQKIPSITKASAAGAAVVLSALVFSLFHYVGPYGDELRLTSFTFRLIAGLFFSALYVTRGFGITAWTHALYDVYLLV